MQDVLQLYTDTLSQNEKINSVNGKFMIN